jgi:5-methylcytosine-specific restriction endonuclease McrA
MSARDKIRAFLEANVGKIVTTHDIAAVAQIRDYQRRIRELRDEEGMQIRSHIDRHDLRPGEYLLESLKRVPVVGRGISPQLRSEILERNGYTCQLCGAGPGDPDPFNPGRKVRLHIDHIIPISQGGTNDKENLRVLCSACNQGRANIQTPSEDARNIVARIRRTSRSVQREIYEVLKRTFGES